MVLSPNHNNNIDSSSATNATAASRLSHQSSFTIRTSMSARSSGLMAGLTTSSAHVRLLQDNSSMSNGDLDNDSFLLMSTGSIPGVSGTAVPPAATAAATASNSGGDKKKAANGKKKKVDDHSSSSDDSAYSEYSEYEEKDDTTNTDGNDTDGLFDPRNARRQALARDFLNEGGTAATTAAAVVNNADSGARRPTLRGILALTEGTRSVTTDQSSTEGDMMDLDHLESRRASVGGKQPRDEPSAAPPAARASFPGSFVRTPPPRSDSGASSRIFNNRTDLREVDQSVNLMDANAHSNNLNNKEQRIPRRARRNTGANNSFKRDGNLSRSNTPPPSGARGNRRGSISEYFVDILLDGSDGPEGGGLLPSFRRALTRQGTNASNPSRNAGNDTSSNSQNNNGNNFYQRRLFYGHTQGTEPQMQPLAWRPLNQSYGDYSARRFMEGPARRPTLMELLCQCCIILFVVVFVFIFAFPQGTYWIQQQMGYTNPHVHEAPSIPDLPTLIPADPIQERLDAIENMILTHRLTSKEDLEDGGSKLKKSFSPQHWAWVWLAQEDPAQLPVVLDDTMIIDTEAVLTRYAMATFYFAMNNHHHLHHDSNSSSAKYEATTFNNAKDYFKKTDHWRNDTLWLRSDHWMSEKDICQWYGMDCEDGRRVVHFNLSHNQLGSGVSQGDDDEYRLPSELRFLSDLRLLDLSNNGITGALLDDDDADEEDADGANNGIWMGNAWTSLEY